MAQYRARLYEIVQAHRKLFAFGLYAAVTAVGYAGAYVLRFELVWNTLYTRTFLVSLPLLIGIRLLAHHVFRLAAGRWRYVGVSDVLRLLAATLVGSMGFAAAAYLMPFDPIVPRSVILIEWTLTTYLTAGVWILYRSSFQFLRRRSWDVERMDARVLVIGAGEAGSRLVHEMVSFRTGYVPLGFVDDDPLKWGARIHGLEVIGATADLKGIVRHVGPDQLIIALPSAEPADLRRLVDACEATGLPYKVLPGISEVLEGRIRVTQLRDIEIEDLLGREPVRLSIPELAEDFAGRSLLITGAAGSIGSELSRQAARHHPATLVLLDQAESALYFLQRELEAQHPELHLVPIVGDVVDETLLEHVFETYSPDRVFHAAAYKHVPLMESNVREAVRNNVVATHLMAEVAGRHRCERFVLISTDKAVHPSNVMGATKCMAEHIVMAAQRRHPTTSYLAVRFGNVLGSQGSVLPLFKKQLEEGRALTVTHPDATRFFMTIPEASQLVLQASILPEAAGRIAMLDMGEPVKILDLARNLVRLSGDARDPDSRITYVGLRPGEKLHEELRSEEEELVDTRIGKVFVLARESVEPAHSLMPWIDRWRDELEDSIVTRKLDAIWTGCGGASSRAASTTEGSPVLPLNRVSGA